MKIETDRDFGSRECPSCGFEVPANTNRCPICNYEFPCPTTTQKGLRIGGALLMLGLLLVLLLLSLW